MRVKVSYLSLLRDVTHVSEEFIDLPSGSTVKDLVAILMKKYGEGLKSFLEPETEMGQGILVTLNGELLSSNEMDKIIPEGSEVLIGIPPFGG
ncbi:MAG: MoaD/ThiS family protein [Candidatus Methanomethyliaceae archaeon]|nr:MoaD/ThiS family protein [Candidatus Methanomethyliaceae archaeon]